MKRWLLCVLAVLVPSMSSASQDHSPAAEVSRAAQQGMAQTAAEGLAFAVIKDGEVTAVEAHGIRNAQRDPLTKQTIMYGASLTKTVFAYFVLQLQDDGLIDLDQTIDTILPKPLPEYEGFRRTHAPYETLAGDDRWKQITPRMLLTHSGGFRNFFFLPPGGGFDWDNGTLDIHFDPGSRYFYSGDGFNLLQFVLEQGLEMDVRKEMRERVFVPLGMDNTDMMWRDAFATNLADGFTSAGESVPHDDRSKVRAAGSMDTTIEDMAKFAAAIAKCERLSSSACEEFFTPTVPIKTATQFVSLTSELPEEAVYPDLSAGPGLIVTKGPRGKTWFKGGHNENTGNTMVCVAEDRDCIVILANDVRAEAAFPLIVKAALGETGVPWEWEYPNLELLGR